MFVVCGCMVNWIYEKKDWNSDGQQFHQYQRNEQPLLNANHSTQKEIVRYVTRNPGPSTYAINTDVLWVVLPQ